MLKKDTRRSLITSITSLVLCFTMLLGSTFAWFTDVVTSSGNKIVSGSLKVDLELLDKESGAWNSLKKTKAPIFEYKNWEPGYVDVKLLKVENEGSLSLKWKASFVSYGEVSELANVIDVYVRPYGVLADASAVTYPATRDLEAENYKRVGTVAEFLSNIGDTTKGVLNAGESAYLGIALKMQESAGNEYQDMDLAGAFDIVIHATQNSYEEDSFGNDYDIGATFPKANINYVASTSIKDNVEAGALKNDVSVGDENSDIKAEVPAGVQLADGADNLELSVTTMEKSEANVVLGENEEMLTLDVHVDGVAEDNTVPMLITLKGIAPAGLNGTSIKLYHVEDGVTKEMTLVSASELDAHNEFTYDVLTGDVVLSLASFSPVALAVDTTNAWKGGVDYSWYNAEDTEFTISSADQLAGFGAIVDGTAKDAQGNTIQDSFNGKTVKLNNDIILNDHDATELKLFDPIGWGYAHADYNVGDVAGKVFEGTFDGQGNAIHGLYQNGWDLEAKTGTDYTYTNCGFGLFAAVHNATIKNLTMKHANVVVECVEAGIVAGLAQGACTFKNIYVYHASIANYQRPAGGVVGEVSPTFNENGDPVRTTCTFDNVHVGSTTTVGTLWGDFDAPVGGVVGAYWDDTTSTSILMKDVDVSCVLDVYNDVTSAYQWYAYRRAGMLIGNSDRSTKNENGTNIAAADYLTCENCVVIYDYEWVNYSYCEFTNNNNPGKNYPWVRVEPGRNNPSYSNPRYGHPVDAVGNKVVDDIHEHQIGDECMTEIVFNQLYGGGQGVYGKPDHPGVSIGKYTITFIGADSHIEDVIYVVDNTKDVSLEGYLPEISRDGKPPLKWEDANGVAYATYDEATKSWTYNKSINAGNLVDYVLYPEWPDEFNIYFIDHENDTLYYEAFTEGSSHALSDEAKAAIEAARWSIQQEYDDTSKVIQVKWKYNGTLITTVEEKNGVMTSTTDFSGIDFKNAKDDITITIELTLSNSSITLEPQYNEANQLYAYHVVDVNESDTNKSITIPARVGHVPVTEVADNAFDGFDNLTSVRIPETLTTLGKGMFPGSTGGFFQAPDLETVTMYYDGDKTKWDAINKTEGWDDTLGNGSRVFFLDDNGKVDLNAGYYELYKHGTNNYEWIFHNHAYTITKMKECSHGEKMHYEYKNNLFGADGVTADKLTPYSQVGRPDRNYWLDENGNPIV